MKAKLTRRQAAELIIQRLRESGHVALLAGGCVRDLLMSLEPKDYDVATDAVPERIIQMFRRTDKVGQQFGVVLVRQGGQSIEVATFRADGCYSDGRRPDSVRFSDAQADAQRRDFTINGMFLDTESGQIIDYVGGRQDIERGIIRAIGEPQLRFEEDHLRMLRAVRFAARFDFAIEPDTFTAIQLHAHCLPRISTERIRGELVLILSDKNRARGWELLQAAGLLPWLIAGVGWSAEQIDRTVAILRHLPVQSGEGLLLAAVLERYAGLDAGGICKALTCSNRVVDEVRWLLDSVPAARLVQSLETADFKQLMAHPDFADLQHLLTARTAAGLEDEALLTAWFEAVERIPAEGVAPLRLVTGDDLLQMGMLPGPKFGRTLQELYRRQLNGELVDRDGALQAARRMMGGE
jgi:tRNA nucleotidyltransferase/poly(A) polymerase